MCSSPTVGEDCRRRLSAKSCLTIACTTQRIVGGGVLGGARPDSKPLRPLRASSPSAQPRYTARKTVPRRYKRLFFGCAKRPRRQYMRPLFLRVGYSAVSAPKNASSLEALATLKGFVAIPSTQLQNMVVVLGILSLLQFFFDFSLKTFR